MKVITLQFLDEFENLAAVDLSNAQELHNLYSDFIRQIEDNEVEAEPVVEFIEDFSNQVFEVMPGGLYDLDAFEGVVNLLFNELGV